MPNDRISPASLVERRVAAEPDYEALSNAVGDLVETSRLLGRAAEHGSASDARGYFEMLLKRVAAVADAFPDLATKNIGRQLEQMHRVALGEARGLSQPARLQKKL